eukprot:CAMPEP_0168730644 /NCGR_PEP_ID=MMETSP0724-20121128/6836_1 /TAXON_ID=265536 /ORGANISM="Amphiprora sp., Strain CCMP467" /LENGTH=206 /DNA_ID=CAMNT_0008777587 /DNA_START=340 /DNA_END=957 /DNA_ORIENTATION=-
MISMLSNDSEHSSVTVGDNAPMKEVTALPTSSCEPQSPSTSTKDCSRVTFDECRNDYFNNDQWDKEDCRSSWYQVQDYKVFREETRNQVLKRKSCKAAQVLRRIYKIVAGVNFVVEVEPLWLLSPKLKDQLLQLFQSPEYLEVIGLEAHIARVKTCTLERRENILDTVYDIQSEYLQGHWKRSEVEEELMESCLNFTQAGCLFAQL